MYREQQQGGLCRMHAINAFFSKRRYDPRQFQALLKEFQEDLEANGFSGHLDIGQYDLFHGSQETIMSYALKKHGIFSTLVPYGHIQKWKDPLADGKMDWNALTTTRDFVFVFNSAHVWGVRRLYNANGGSNEWYLIDSMKPIRRLGCLNHYIKTLGNTHGLVIPRHRHQAIRLFDAYVSKSHQVVLESLHNYYGLHKGLHELEIWLNVATEAIRYTYKDYDDIRQRCLDLRSKWEGNRAQAGLLLKDIEVLILDLYAFRNNLENSNNNK